MKLSVLSSSSFSPTQTQPIICFPTAMASYLSPLLAPLFLTFFSQLLLVPPTNAICSTSVSNKNAVVNFVKCIDLTSSSASLAWTFFENNSTLSVAYTDTALSQAGWVGWGINFDGTTMVGTNTLIAFQASNGSVVLPYKLTRQIYNNPSIPLKSSEIDLQILDKSVQIIGTSFAIFATLRLSANQTTLNHVWNRGPSVSNYIPAPHSLSDLNFLKGMQTIDMSTGEVTGAGQSPHQTLKNVHGILNAVSWGFLLLVGGMSARYLRPFAIADPAWFYIHIFCQCAGYILGVTGWATGLKLGRYSKGVVQHVHRSVGISIFALATLQVLALFMRPQKEHKSRRYWNVYHHFVGYTCIILGIINIFQGFSLLAPPQRYKVAYIATLAALGGFSAVLEVVTWVVYIRRRKLTKSENSQKAASNGMLRMYAGSGGIHPYVYTRGGVHLYAANDVASGWNPESWRCT